MPLGEGAAAGMRAGKERQDPRCPLVDVEDALQEAHLLTRIGRGPERSSRKATGRTSGEEDDGTELLVDPLAGLAAVAGKFSELAVKVAER